MPFVSLVSGVAHPYITPVHVSDAVAPVANVAPLHEGVSSAATQAGQGEGSRAATAYRAQRDGRDEADTRQPALVAGDLMSRPVQTVPEDASLSSARALIRLRRFRHLPVVSPHGVPVGMLSDRDLLAEPPANALLVRDIMTRDVLSATPTTQLRDIAQVMVAERIGALPVVDEDRVLVGIVTTSDILAAIVRGAPVDLWT